MCHYEVDILFTCNKRLPQGIDAESLSVKGYNYNPYGRIPKRGLPATLTPMPFTIANKGLEVYT